MKLVITGIYPPEIGGPATYAALLEQELPESGIDVQVVPFGSVRRLPPLIRHVVYFWKIFQVARVSDWVLAQDTFSSAVPSWAAARLSGRPFVIRVPGDYAWEQSVQRFGVRDSVDDFQKNRYGFRTEFLRAVQSFVVRRADKVIVPSNYFSGIVQGWGALPENTRTIYNGVDLLEEGVLPEKSTAHPYMISIGRLVPWKGFGLLVGLLEDMPEWNLVIVGDGPERQSLKDLASKLGVETRLTFTGAIPRSEVLGWLQGADAFVLNTHFESFSFQTVEAMHSGTPVIITKVGSLPELVSTGREGVLLQPDDAQGFKEALVSTQEDRGTWVERTDLAKKKAQKFSINNTVSSVEELLKNI